ncbi:MAG: MBL fold metallo-hydrolase [Clostridia bacterium]|nr:MBL fold metallo-hydrolase [Clostridia bacterium]
MFDKRKLFFLFTIAVIILCLFGCSAQTGKESGSPAFDNQKETVYPDRGNLEVHYLDVGQGDSILIKLPNGKNILIDAGTNGAAQTVSGYLGSLGINKLDYVIGTHPHEDHIGGMDVIIKEFAIGDVYLPKVGHTSKSFEDLLTAIKEKGLKIKEAKSGISLDLGNEVMGIFLAPNGSEYENLNDYSAVLKLTYGETEFIFTGDAQGKSEEEMLLMAPVPLTADVLKVGHHGSFTSTGQLFLDKVSPKYAVISAGRNNEYGHPHREILERLEKNNIKVFRTDLEGTIIAVSNGKEIIFNVERTATASSQETAGLIKIAAVDLVQELVVIQNMGSTSVDMSGWKLVSRKGNDEFVFPENFVLKAGRSVRIVSGPGAAPGKDTIVWTTKNIWNNSGDPAVLYDEKGQEISSMP